MTTLQLIHHYLSQHPQITHLYPPTCTHDRQFITANGHTIHTHNQTITTWPQATATKSTDIDLANPNSLTDLLNHLTK